MALRCTFSDLAGFDVSKPVAVTINCSYWFMVLREVASGQLLDGNELSSFCSTGDETLRPSGRVDFPPMFDANGRAIPWRQVVHFTPGNVRLRVMVVQVFNDPATIA